MSTMVDNSRWDQRYQNQQGPITSGFVSNSDIRQKEKQEQIRSERQREYQDIMNKPGEPNNSRQGSREQHEPPVYYKTGGVSELSLPIGNYEESRRVLDDQRQREYNIYITQKKDAENKRREDLYLNARQNYKAPPEPDMYDHSQISKDLREERQNEYNDYLKKKQSEESSRIRHRHRYTPPGGLPIGQYDIQRKKLQQQLKNEYKESLMKQRQDQLVFRAKEFQLDASPEYLGNLNEERPLVGSPSPRNFSDLLTYQREKENMQSRRRVPPTPPGGLNIATEQERKRVEDLKKSQYRDELLKQQNEQLYNRAQQQGEIPVLNRSSPTQAPPNQISPRGRPPPHPDSIRQRGQPPQDDRMCQNHMEQSRQTPNFWDEGRQAPSPKSVEDELATSNKSHVVDSQNKSRENDRRPQEEIRTGFFDDRRRTPPNRDERQQDYQNYLADNQRKDEMRRQKLDEMRQAPQPGVSKGTYYNSDTYEQKRQSLNSQRREEYQNFLSKHYRHQTPRYGLPIGQYRYIPLRKSLEKQRNQEYNDYLEKQNPGSSRSKKESSTLTSLPLYQDKYDVHYKTLKQMRNEEYNQLLDETNRPSYRQYTPENMQGLPINQNRYDQAKRIQEQQRNREYNEHLAKKSPDQRERRQWNDHSDPKGIIAGVDSYNYEKRKVFADERKQEYKDIMEKKNEVYKKQKEDRDSFRATLDRELMESPPIIPIGEYDTKKRHFQQEAHKEMISFLERQPHVNRDKEFWDKTAKPRILPQSGEYKNRKQKLNDELRKDWREYVLKQEPPKERIKEFGSPGAVLFTGEYEKTRKKVREERTKDYHEFMKKYGHQQPKRVPEQPPANSIGFMANLGFHEQERDKLNKEKRDEYNKFLDEDSWYNQEPPPFNKTPGPARDQEPPRERPGSFNRRPSPSYQEILDSKRKQEASYRRFDDPEYSRSGAPQGGPGPDYSRAPGGPNDGYMGRYD